MCFVNIYVVRSPSIFLWQIVDSTFKYFYMFNRQVYFFLMACVMASVLILTWCIPKTFLHSYFFEICMSFRFLFLQIKCPKLRTFFTSIYCSKRAFNYSLEDTNAYLIKIIWRTQICYCSLDIEKVYCWSRVLVKKRCVISALVILDIASTV